MASSTILGGSRVVVFGVLSPLIVLVRIAALLISPFITAHEPPSNPL